MMIPCSPSSRHGECKAASRANNKKALESYEKQSPMMIAARLSFSFGTVGWILAMIARYGVPGGMASSWAIAISIMEMITFPSALAFLAMLYFPKDRRFATGFGVFYRSREEVDAMTTSSDDSFSESLSSSSDHEDHQENDQENVADDFDTICIDHTWDVEVLSKYDEYKYNADGATTLPSNLMLARQFEVEVLLRMQTDPPRHADQEEPTRPITSQTKHSTVDIFITCYQEDDKVIEKTLRTAVHLPRPKWITKVVVYLLDDGGKPSRNEMCQRIGATYVCRPNRGFHAKAGNLNHGLSVASGDLLMVLDADMVPTDGSLVHLCACVELHDPETKLAFVQSPQRFHDIKKLDLFGSRNTCFMDRIQCLFGGAGYVQFIGTGAIFVRAAIDHVGGFPGGYATEDVAMALQLHRQGYRSIFTPFEVAVGTSPQTAGELLAQRSRWSWGEMEVLFDQWIFFNPKVPWRVQIIWANNFAFQFMLPCIILIYVVISGSLIVNANIIPEQKWMRLLFVVFIFLKLGVYLFADSGFSRRQVLVYLIDFTIYDSYYLLVVALVLNMYLAIKFIVCGGKRVKFLSAGAVSGMKMEDLLVIGFIVSFGLFFLLGAAYGFYRALTLNAAGNAYDFAFLGALMFLEGVRFIASAVHLLFPFPEPVSTGDEELSSSWKADSLHQASRTRWVCAAISIPLIQLALFLIATISTAMDMLGKL